MQTTIFPLASQLRVATSGNMFSTSFRVPTLDAYAISSVVVHLGALSVPAPLDWISGDTVTVTTEYDLHNIECHLTISYIGIRDYALLFPAVVSSTLKTRLGEFYSEMEVAFENSAWLSFILMTSAVIEGILFSKIGQDDTFEVLINKAHKKLLVSDSDKSLLHVMREYRNLVHAGRHAQPYVLRQHAMDSRVLVERLVRKE